MGAAVAIVEVSTPEQLESLRNLFRSYRSSFSASASFLTASGSPCRGRTRRRVAVCFWLTFPLNRPDVLHCVRFPNKVPAR